MSISNNETFIPRGSWFNSQIKYQIKKDKLYAELYDCNGKIHCRNIKFNKDFAYSNINGNFDIEEYNNTLFIIIGNQLGNCLRVITSCLIIAEYYNMHVFIDLDKNYLADKDKEVIQILFPTLCKHNIIFQYTFLKYNDYVKYEKMPCTNYNLICEGIFQKPTNINNFGIDYNIYSIIPGNMNKDVYISKKIKIYQNIAWPDFLLKDIENFLSQFNLSTFISFHIRYTDNLNDDSKKHFNTQIEIFINKMESFDNTNILLCSDNSEIINNFKNKKNYKNNLIFANQCSNPHFQHIYEMILLSKTKLIIGSNSSTFSYESAFLEGTDIELYEDEAWKLYKLSKYKT
jgi:hypothetical protein